MIENKSIENGNITCRIMREDGKSFCELSYYENLMDTMWFSSFHVEAQCRNKGLGNEMLDYVINKAHFLGCKIIHLRVLTGSWMESWYTKKGFEPYSKEDEYTYMFKRL